MVGLVVGGIVAGWHRGKSCVLWQVSVAQGLACHDGVVLWVLCMLGWCCSRSCTCWGLHAMLG